jgi:23S rRNA U2552 (ribose-2'-O)-methylase RlmE/FtsJ
MSIKEKIDLKTERMKGYGPYLIDGYEVNYLYGLNDLCEKYVKKDFTILELGSNNGISTTLFSHFAKKVIAVDINKTLDMELLILNSYNIDFNHMSFSQFIEIDGKNKYDLVYIDGAHDYNNVKKDILNFLPKVKIGGYITGHDYNTADYGVIQAVNEIFPLDNIETFSDSSWLVKIK